MVRHDAAAKTKIVHMSTVPMTLWAFLTPHLRAATGAGHQVAVISSPGPLLDEVAATCGVDAEAVPMARSISPLRDLLSVCRLVRVLLTVRPDILVCHTPKAALLGLVAGSLCRVKRRVYYIHGSLLLTATGWRHRILTLTEMVSCHLAHRIYCVSASLRQDLEDRGLGGKKLAILAKGSISGVDTRERFNPTRYGAADRLKIKQSLGFTATDVVVTFIGRLHPDKGIDVLLEAWQQVRQRTAARLLIVGPDDGAREDLERWQAIIDAAEDSIKRLPFTRDIPAILAMTDLFALPSWREGFCVTLLEAASMAVPTVTSDAVGCRDAVEDGITGFIVPRGDADRLAEAIIRCADDAALRQRLGANGRSMALRDFDQDLVVAEALRGITRD